jgi:hypothetical protein
MSNIIRRAVCLAFLFAVPLAADPYHPSLEKSQVVTLDAKAIEESANGGKPFDLDLGETEVNVTLAPAPIFPAEGVTVTEVTEDGSETTRVVRVPNFTYVGEITGEDPTVTEVRLSIPGGVVEGYVRTSTDWWFIEPLARFYPKAPSDQYLIYEARDVTVDIAFAQTVPGMDEVSQNSTFKDDRIPITMVADFEYWKDSDRDELKVMLRQGTLMHNVNGIFQAQFGRGFRIPHYAFDSGLRLLGNDAQALLNKLKDWWKLERLLEKGTIMAHLTTGKVLCDDVYGKGEQPGRRSLSRQRTAESLAFENMIFAAHEIGHNFDADHGEVEQDVIPGTNLVWRQTLDAESYNPYAETIPEFADGDPIPARNNVVRMCVVMAMRGFPCQ